MNIHHVKPAYSDAAHTGIDLRATLAELAKSEAPRGDSCLLIEGLSLSEALWLARGIRLSLCFTGRVALCPIVLLPSEGADESLDDFLGLDCDVSHVTAAASVAPELQVIMHTPQVYLADPADDMQTLAEDARPLEAADFERFMAMTKVTGQHGSHAIANEWSAYTLGRLLRIPGSDAIPATRDLVFLCYLLLSGMSRADRAALCATGQRPPEKARAKIRRVAASRKKILLIDDQDDIWAPVISNLIGQNNRLTVWGKADIARAEGEIRLHGMRPAEWAGNIVDNFDLVLLDMRLFEEQVSNPGNELSGLAVLKQIMDLNRGQRVIMFTSSNKVWNIRRSLELGAADIFIKESPQYPMTEDARATALQELIDNIQEALGQDWLKDVCVMAYATIDEAERRAETEDQNDRDGGLRIDLYLDIADQTASALEIFMNAGKDPKKLQLAYFQLYYVCELCLQYYKTVTGLKVVELDDLKILFGLDRYRDDYLIKSLTPLRLMRNRLAHSEERDSEEFYIGSRDNRHNWILGEKSSGTPVQHLFGASHPNAFRALMYTVSRLVAKDLMN